MLRALADAVWFEMIDARVVFASSERDALLYDFDGVAWPKSSALVGPFRARGKRPASRDVDRATLAWFGKRHELRAGDLELPPIELRAWRGLGDVRRVFYDRRGVDGHKPPGAKHHEFNVPNMWDCFEPRKPPVRLYLRGAFLRLELPKGAIVDERGFARP